MLYNPNNIFAKIIRGEVECSKVYEDNQIIAFNDIAPIAPVHILVVPKLECRNFTDFINLATSENIAYFFNKLSETDFRSAIGVAATIPVPEPPVGE